MASNVNPTVRRRRLGQELRRLRELKGMTAEEVAERLLVSQSKISRLENGRRSISQRDVRDLCGVYEVEDHRIVDSLMQMAKDSRQQAGGTPSATSRTASTSVWRRTRRASGSTIPRSSLACCRRVSTRRR